MSSKFLVALLLIFLIVGCAQLDELTNDTTDETVNTSGTTINLSEDDFDNLMDDLEDMGFEDLGGLSE